MMNVFVSYAESIQEAIAARYEMDSASRAEAKYAQMNKVRSVQEWVQHQRNGKISDMRALLSNPTIQHSGMTPEKTVTKRNQFTGALTAHGAILLAYGRAEDMNLCLWSLSGYCHAGIFNRNLYINETSSAIRTANTNGGMQLESPRYWRQFEEVREMQVLGVTDSVRKLVVKRAMGYVGKYLLSGKVDYSSWYCSKVIYRAYLDVTGIDLDSNQGMLVFPSDIRWSVWTRTTRVYTP